MPESAGLPPSSVEQATILSLVLSVLGDDPKLLRSALENAATIAEQVSLMDLTLVRIRTRLEDDQVREHWTKAALLLRAWHAKVDQLGPF